MVRFSADRGGRKGKHEVCRWVCSRVVDKSGNVGTARRVRDWPWGMPNSLDVLLMQVAYERRVVAIGVLRPHAGLAALRGSVRDGGREERIDRIGVLGGEGNMRRRGHGQPAADREVVPSLRPITEAVVLNIKFLIAEWSEGGCIEPPARVEVRHNEEHVVDDDAASNHAPRTLSTS